MSFSWPSVKVSLDLAIVHKLQILMYPIQQYTRERKVGEDDMIV